MKIITYIIAVIFLLVISLSLLIAFIFYTPTGLQWITRIIPYVEIGEASGILAKQFELKNLHYKNNHDEITIEKIDISWDFPQLFKRALIIQHLDVTGLVMNLKNQSDSSTPFKLPAWAPNHYVVSRLSFSPFSYNSIAIPQSQWRGDVFIKNDHIELQQLAGDITDARNMAHVDLKFVKTLQGEWHIRINDFSRYEPNTTGTLISTGNLNDKNINIFFDLQHLRYKDTKIKHVKLALRGMLNNQQLQLSLQPKDFVFDQWKLKQTANLALSQEAASIDHLALENPQASFTVSGNWKKSGDWQLSEIGKYPLKEYNITPTFNLTQKGKGGAIIYEGIITSGNGTIQLRGQTNHDVTTLSLKGTNFLAMNTDDYQVWASPDLMLKNSQARWDLSGKLFIPKAGINPPDFGNQVITLPNDVVFVDNQTRSPSAFPLYSNIQLTLGNEIRVSAQGVTGKIAGKLTLHDTPQQFTTANGRLTIVDGQYQVYGQTLKIKYGDLIFNNSPVSNPGLHIRATKKIEVSNTSGAGLAAVDVNNLSGSLTVGVDVAGTLEEPQITLFSMPATLSQMDILSYLVLGHPASDASPLDARLLLQATTSMNMGGDQVEQLMRELQNTFGFDKLSIESINYIDPTAKTPTLSQTTALVLGKALSPRLYISYSAGLLSAVNIFTIKYTLSKKWLLQSTTSNFGSGIDIFRVW